ncbi:hypothetical protein BC939DRAFT_3140 [Gamsiella multidivaricata]|uniref:uncharacterized protein n=1 Tax=Gamsiella multidivaricata TaxID=101098 RepID=UPI0022204CE7|nr:uncharacterized protein BC939DRAFT_3140 [Gamsiella multidivaricata]KAI7832650.1 hypothetical protein BC939DRAFT_3140 [Gamsiella multidivaricata]
MFSANAFVLLLLTTAGYNAASMCTVWCRCRPFLDGTHLPPLSTARTLFSTNHKLVFSVLARPHGYEGARVFSLHVRPPLPPLFPSLFTPVPKKQFTLTHIPKHSHILKRPCPLFIPILILMSSSFCRDPEGWGPTSHERADLTLCFEST